LISESASASSYNKAGACVVVDMKLWYGGALAMCSAKGFELSKLEWVSDLNALDGNADCDNHLRATPPVLSLWPCKENWMKKSQNMMVWLSKMVLTQHFRTR
jgi:hypothetical protein